MRAIGAEGDPNGCPARLTPGGDPSGGRPLGLPVRRDRALEQSEALSERTPARPSRALQAGAASPGRARDTSQGSQPHQVIVIEAPGISASVDLVAAARA